MKTLQFCEIRDEQISDHDFIYHVVAEYMDCDGYFVRTTHFSSTSLEEANEWGQKYDEVFLQFQDSLTEDEIEENKNLDFDAFYEFAIERGFNIDYFDVYAIRH